MLVDMENWNRLPKRLFISHAYADGEQVADLLKLLREQVNQVEPIVWPRKEPDPRTAVSNGIVETIQRSSALIYLRDGASEESLWVNFERDFALRLGREVYAYDPITKKLERDIGRPISLDVELLVSPYAANRATQLLNWMDDKRSFRFERSPKTVRLKEISTLVAELLSIGRPMLWLLDSKLTGCAGFAFDLPTELLLQDEAADSGIYLAGSSKFDYYAEWMAENSLFVRISNDWKLTTSSDSDIQEYILSTHPVERQFHSGWAVDLLRSTDDAEIDWNRADDLIVKMTLICQRTRPFLPEHNE